MANLAETPTFATGVYRIETTDPIIGGENGISNIQAKQLACRTAYLKARADLVDAAAGSFPNLSMRLDDIDSTLESVGPQMMNAEVGAIKFLFDQVNQANLGVRYLREVWQQEGKVTFTNRGVVEGCIVSKSSTATRNLNITPGKCFGMGNIWPVSEGINAASVPSNPGDGAIEVSVYLYPVGNYNYSLAVQSPGEEPLRYNGAIEIYTLVIPAGNTDATDPYLDNVTLLDVRRLEPNFPNITYEFPFVQIALEHNLRDDDYRFDFDVKSASGHLHSRESVSCFRIGPNGFILALVAAADDVVVLWRISKLNQ